ncbi:hypothetical protein SERLADRAFT_462878 [Serpula lacrymans var. lacrymans S7.9]|nr:uncharacterized protein SERLADRAFT_462878 [Serpula lacrymans var. lacrymans S7.9]EGO26147.1 hypothetical protein SERLADRAFT_462878 [Serpula lacrymans var. lacrymans S7.9]
MEEEYVRARRKPVRDINDWGAVDIEALTMSLRSRLATELSYGLTTFSLLSTMRGPTQGSGFPIFQCLDLLEEVLDLMEEQAFEGTPDVAEYALTEETCIPRHRELLDTAYDEESQHFAGLQPRQGSGDSSYGPRQRPGTIILAVMNILRNLSIIADNMTFLAHHERVLDLALRVCGVTVQDGSPPRANSPALSLIDVATVRKDTLYILTSIAGMIQYPPSRSPSSTTTRIASRTFELIASFLIDPVDAVSPVTYLRQTGGPPTSSKPPPLSDIALEVFTRLGHPDHNRMVFSKVIPQTWQWRLFEALIHRLPISDADYGLLAREAWLSYLEKLTMAIYALAFLAPPDLKQKIKMDRSLSFSQVMLRMVQRLLVGPNPETRAWYMIAARRSVEAMKVVDGCEDSFDTSQSTVPTLAFGVGYGEAGDNGVEKGTGMLGGRCEVAWDLLMLRDMEPPMFAELESLMRVE